MTSLTEVYDRDASLRRLTLGIGLFGGGALATLVGVVLATTAVGNATLGLYGAREVAGVLAGVGVPAALVGVLTVLPARPAVRVISLIGAGLTLVAVVLFVDVYPARWGTPRLTALTLSVYALGTVVAFWALFAGVTTLQRRRGPGGTVRLEVRDGEPRIITVPRRLRSGLGGVGFLGSTPDGGIDTQTAARSDGGATVLDGEADTGPSGEATGTEREQAAQSPGADPYCGNCDHFKYVRTDDGLQPYCGFHGDLMDDMEACADWTTNTDGHTELHAGPTSASDRSAHSGDGEAAPAAGDTGTTTSTDDAELLE